MFQVDIKPPLLADNNSDVRGVGNPAKSRPGIIIAMRTKMHCERLQPYVEINKFDPPNKVATQTANHGRTSAQPLHYKHKVEGSSSYFKQ